LVADVSGMQQDIVSRKTALQTMDTPAQAHLIWCTLVQATAKNRTIVVIRLSIVMYLMTVCSIDYVMLV